MMDWTPRTVVYAALSFGSYHSECYFCDTTITGWNVLAMNVKISLHLSVRHGDVDPGELSEGEMEEIRDHMAVRGSGPNAEPTGVET